MKRIHALVDNKSDNSVIMTLLFALPLFTVLPLGIDLFMPALNDIDHFFGQGHGVAEWTMSIYVIFWGVGQMLWGRVCDIIGRRKVALIGFVLFAVASYLIVEVQAGYSERFLSYRAMQSFGGSGAFAAIYAIIRDRFDGEKLGKAYSYLNGILSVIPVCAPLLGAVILQANSWQIIFTLFGVVGIVSVMWSFLFTVETYEKAATQSRSESILTTYKHIITNKNFLFYLVFPTSGLFGFMFYNNIAPMYIMNHLGVDKLTFGQIFMILAVVFGAGSFIAPEVLKRIGIRKTLMLGIALYISGGVLGYLLAPLDMWQSYIFPLAITAMGCTLMQGTCPAFALQDFKEHAGTASGLFSALYFGIGSALAGYFAGVVNTSSSQDFAVVYTLVGVLLAVLFFVMRKNSQLLPK